MLQKKKMPVEGMAVFSLKRIKKGGGVSFMTICDPDCEEHRTEYIYNVVKRLGSSIQVLSEVVFTPCTFTVNSPGDLLLSLQIFSSSDP